MISSIVKVIQGWVKLRGGTDGALIGNSSDKLKTETTFSHENSLTSFGVIKQISYFSKLSITFPFDKSPLELSEVVATGGTNTWNTNTKSIDLVVSATSGSSVTLQSKKRCEYSPDKSVGLQLSINVGGLKANCERKIGQFDIDNGVYFKFNTAASVNILSKTSGTAVETSIAQSSWNIDKFDGTGKSGITIDFSKAQLYVIEYGWQGVASVKFGFYLDGTVKWCHEFKTTNVLTLPYMASANLPLKFIITNTAATASATTMSITCVIVKNYGLEDTIDGFTKAHGRISLKTASTTFTPILSFRINATNLNAIVEFLRTELYCMTVDDAQWTLILNPTLTGSTFAVTNGYLQIDEAATALTGGTVLDIGHIAQRQSSLSVSTPSLRYLNKIFGVSLAGTSDVLTIAARAQTGTADFIGSCTWREV
jgi:hypothetical protein